MNISEQSISVKGIHFKFKNAVKVLTKNSMNLNKSRQVIVTIILSIAQVYHIMKDIE